MKISPDNIKKQEFSKSVRGFDNEEVNAFLEKLADDIQELQDENDSLKKELETANIRLEEFKKIKDSLNETLVKTHEASSKTIESTKKRTSLMIREAEIKATHILEKAGESAKEVRSSLINLREERELIVAKLKAIVNSQARLLDMKVADAGEEDIEQNKIEQKEKIILDVNSIVDNIS